MTLAAGDTTILEKGNTYINQGTVNITAVSGGYSAISGAPYTVVRSGATCNSATWRWASKPTPAATQATVELYTGSTLKATGTSSYANGYIGRN